MTKIETLRKEYLSLCHAMQTGVAYDHSHGSDDGLPKHLRVGVNVALSDHGALVKLLLDKGVITEEEYYSAMVAGMRAEVDRYQKRLTEKMGGVGVTLA